MMRGLLSRKGTLISAEIEIGNVLFVHRPLWGRKGTLISAEIEIEKDLLYEDENFVGRKGTLISAEIEIDGGITLDEYREAVARGR